MTKKVDLVLKKVLENIELEKEKLLKIDFELEKFLRRVEKRISKLKIDAEFFVGGSYAKNSLIRRDKYDVDIFLRFDKKYVEKDFGKLSKKILRGIRGRTVVHGSRDYFKIKINSWLDFEIVPVRKVKNPRESKNITDLSYSHVKYINSKVKKKEIIRGIKLAKAFCYANRTYGAESYVHGFSGYALELLIYNFGSFEKFLRAMVKVKKEKLVIDVGKLYKNKKAVLIDMNASKLDSPVILVDPTFKSRNALAALSSETFEKFCIFAREFLNNPSYEFFKIKKVDYDELKKSASVGGKEFILIKTKTWKQKGDIAGTKLLKFFRHLNFEFSKYFEVNDSGFDYVGGKYGLNYFVLKPRKEIVFVGPLVKDSKNSEKFKLERSGVFVEKGRLFSKMKIDFKGREFFKKWVKKNRRKVKQMYVKGLKLVG